MALFENLPRGIPTAARHPVQAVRLGTERAPGFPWMGILAVVGLCCGALAIFPLNVISIALTILLDALRARFHKLYCVRRIHHPFCSPPSCSHRLLACPVVPHPPSSPLPVRLCRLGCFKELAARAQVEDAVQLAQEDCSSLRVSVIIPVS